MGCDRDADPLATTLLPTEVPPLKNSTEPAAAVGVTIAVNVASAGAVVGEAGATARTTEVSVLLPATGETV